MLHLMNLFNVANVGYFIFHFGNFLAYVY